MSIFPSLDAQLVEDKGEIIAAIHASHHALVALIEQGFKNMATADDVNTAMDALTVKVTNLETTDASLAAYVTGIKGQITSLTNQLTAAGTDPAKLDTAISALTALGTRIDAVSAADAVIETP